MSYYFKKGERGKGGRRESMRSSSQIEDLIKLTLLKAE